MLILEVLEEAGYTVDRGRRRPVRAEDPAIAGRIDLLITDVGLPGGMNGRQVADAARAHAART